jgi:hypothetical protein
MTQPQSRSRGPIATHPVTSAVIAVVTIAAIFFVLWVPIYASETPKVGTFPWFYFYLLAYMPVVAIACWIVITLQKRLRPPGAADDPAAGPGSGAGRGGAR